MLNVRRKRFKTLINEFFAGTFLTALDADGSWNFLPVDSTVRIPDRTHIKATLERGLLAGKAPSSSTSDALSRSQLLKRKLADDDDDVEVVGDDDVNGASEPKETRSDDPDNIEAELELMILPKAATATTINDDNHNRIGK